MMTRLLLRMAFRALCHHVLRSLLTLLGIVIGIMGIITINAVGKGAQQRAREQWLAYGTKSISVNKGNWMSPSKKPAKQLLLSDTATLKAQCPQIEYISPNMARHNVDIEYEGQEAKADVYGVNEQQLYIDERSLTCGIFFNQQHIDRKENVVVLPPDLAERLFKRNNPVGKFIRIDKKPFEVIGVLAPKKFKGKFDGLGSPELLIPFSTHKKYYACQIRSINMSAYQEKQVAQISRQVEKIMRATHTLSPGESNDFMIFDTQTFAQAAEKASQSVGLFAFIAALIALLVGGIGVMNILLVAVQERTKEIGIKGALGAPMNSIRLQFLFEAVAICLAGGMLGVASGISAALILNTWFGILTIIELTPVLVALSSTIFLGLIFGIYPAERAARLDPVKALIEH